MARKTDGEKVDELVIVAAILSERLENVRLELKELKKEIETSRGRLWLIVPPLIAALASAGLMAVVSLLLRH